MQSSVCHVLQVMSAKGSAAAAKVRHLSKGIFVMSCKGFMATIKVYQFLTLLASCHINLRSYEDICPQQRVHSNVPLQRSGLQCHAGRLQ